MSVSMRFTALPSAARTTSGVAPIGDLPSDYSELVVFLNVTAVTGTTPSMTVTYQISPDGTNWYDHTAGTAITAATNQAIRIPNTIGTIGRLSYAITGTTPSFTFSAIAEAKRMEV